MDNNTLLIAIISVVGAVILPIAAGSYILIYWLKSRASERMELLKQGIIPATQLKANPNKYTMLRNGCLFIGLAIGLLVGIVIDYSMDYNDFGTFMFVTASTILFLGFGYIAFYLLVKDKPADEE